MSYLLDDGTRAAARQFGRDVKAARKELKLTQRELARICHSNFHTIEAIENRGATPASEMFFILCEELGLIPEDYRFEGEHEIIISKWRATNPRCD
jgi:transcriptional regulator with XRE-family HTH domain